ncbi:hypothetical protein REPUB_Repub20aG0130200 [Reevesia pubescens]
MPPCQTCGSPNLSPPAPEAALPELAPTPPADIPEPNLSPPAPEAASPESATTPPADSPETVPSCKTCGSPNLSPPAPEAASPEPAPTPLADSPETNKGPKDGVFDVTEHGAVADGGTESSSVCTS